MPFAKERKENNDEFLWKSQENFFSNKKNYDNLLHNSKNESMSLEENNTKLNTFTKKKFAKLSNLGIDTEAINELYLFGGDKHESNLSEEKRQLNLEDKIKLLAKHCVDYMQGSKNFNCNNNSMNFKEELNCEFFRSDILFRDKEVDISEINESLNNFKYTKNKNDTIDNSSSENAAEIIDNNKFSKEKITQKDEIKYNDFSINKLNLKSKRFNESNNKYNSFSARAPLPTSKNKESKNFCFGKKLQLKTFPDDSITNSFNKTYNEISEKNETDFMKIPENKNDNLILPKNKKSFLKNKKPNRKK